MSGPARWLDVKEKGGVLGVRFVVWLCTAFGRAPARAFLAVLCVYYAVLHGPVRRASRAYLRRVGAPHGFWDAYRHVLTFARCALDRFFLLTGRGDLFALESHGTEHLRAAQEAGRGAVLLGAHLGSFEALRAQGRSRRYPINIVGYFGNARVINAAIEAIDPGAMTRVIEIDPDGMDYILALKERVERGEFVAILADRTGLNGRVAEVDFLGGRVKLPVGPYLLAASLRCPVFLTFGVYTEPNRYDLHCEPFADPLVIDRRDREGALQAIAQRYAARLEHYARLAPDYWFNVYDYWGDA
jgi:predicted LPLAT superfamily acyltransferase